MTAIDHAKQSLKNLKKVGKDTKSEDKCNLKIYLIYTLHDQIGNKFYQNLTDIHVLKI